ncbi:MAG: GHKL domain-containing protein [Selenomonadaceae bacterium]|nr:GHKL domain-containing protein [Selenomonadaceae bacterium]
MFELEILDFIVSIAGGVISFMYAEKFFPHRFVNRRKSIIIWSIVYAIEQVAVSNLTTYLSPYDRFIIIFPQILILFVLQKIFFVQDKAKEIFTVASFVAGWEILRFIASPLSHVILSIWSPIWTEIFNRLIALYPTSTNDIIFRMEIINRVAIFIVLAICRAVQLTILIFYLHVIAKNFTRREYELKFRDSLFLIFPCVTVLFIDLTVRLTAFSVHNGAAFLIYEREPATILLLPIVSCLLLGVIISSVILFQNLINFKDEEQKRLLLENRAVEVHREIEELQNIYDDIRGLRHDLHNHIENISACVRGNVELENYLRGMSATVERLNFSDKTGNPITDIILHQTRQRANKKFIRFDANFTCPKNFDVYDVSIILNNALENAIEACAKVDREKFISIRSYMRGNLFFIEVENNFNGGLEKDFATTKSDKNLHGLGLKNIRRCSQKYLGDIDIKVSENIFKLTVMLYKNFSDAYAQQ